MSDEVEVMNSLLAKIYGVIGEKDPVNAIPGQEAYVSFTRPGIPLTEESLTFSFIASSLAEADSAAGYSDLVNIIPAASSFWQPSGRRVNDEYWRCIDQPILPVDELTSEETKRLASAIAVLEMETSIVDHNTGEIKNVKTESLLYQRYLEKEASYLSALTAYNSAFEDYISVRGSDQHAEMIWLRREPALHKRVQSAFRLWQASGKMQIETAIATRESLERRGAERIFEERRQRFLQHQRSLGDAGANFQFSKYFPDKFWESSDNWTTVTFGHKEVHTVDKQTLEKMGGGGGASFGLWSVGGSFNRSTDDRYFKSDTSNLAVKFSLAKIPIRRSWLDAGVFRNNNWALNYQLTSRASNISDGNGGGTMPLMPVAILVARDVKLRFATSSTENTFALSEISGSARGGWGPFSVKGNYHKKTTKQTHDFVSDSEGIEVKGMQIIGFVLERMPKIPNPDPALNWPKGTKFDAINPDPAAAPAT